MAVDSKMNGVGSTWRASVPATLVILSFLSSGAWLLVMLPPVPMAKALNLVTLGFWLLAFGFGAAGFARPERRVLWALCAVAGSAAVSFLVGGSHFAVAFYDLYADMPLMQWLAFPVMFVLAAGLQAGQTRVEMGLSGVVILGTVLSVVMSFQQFTTNGSGVFGSTAYSVTALVPLIPLAVWLGATRHGAVCWVWYGCAATIVVALGALSGATMGALAAGFAILVSVVVHPAVLSARAGGLRAVRRASLGLALAMVVGLAFVQFPALSGRWVNANVLGTQKNAVSRIYLWEGAQDMVTARPVFGFGTSGYRMAAVDYLRPEALQFGSDQLGNIDPTVFSPQSPHSLIWEIATRLGLVGLLAFGALLVTWAMALRGLVRANEPTAGLRTALAASFACALFALMVNPVIFAIGLFAPVAAGLAISPMAARPGRATAPVRPSLTWLFAVAGIAVVLVAGGTFMGEWRAYTVRFDEPAAAVAGYESALRITPGNPLTTRRLLENRLLMASDAEIGPAQTAVDAAPAYIRSFGPNLSNFAAYSLAQAARTGRKDLSWEQRLLTAAAAQMPPIPSTVAEELHLAVLSGDVTAVDRALPDAERWGKPYPYTAAYIEAAQKLKSTPR